MANQVNRNDAMLSANTFNVKEEQCHEYNFVEDKVCISETSIIVDYVKVQDPIWHGKTKQYEESTCLENVKTELAYFEVTEVQTGNVKIEGGIKSDDIKIELNKGLLYCEYCEAYYADYCIECGMLEHILNRCALNNADSGARDDIPNDILEIQDCSRQTGIYALRTIPAGVKFGPFTGLSATECPWTMEGVKFVLDKNKSTYLNWMQYINPTTKTSDRNLHILQCDDNIYYQSTRQIMAGEELLVYFVEELGSIQNNIFRVDFVTTTKHTIKDIFACTFCCLGFSSRLHLAKHKTVCVANAAGKLSIEELVQCRFCKIHMDSKEYYEHHMAFCCERNARKGILPTPSAKQSTATLNGGRRCLRPIYNCEQCKYRTKYQADLKEHTNNHHYEVKMYRCGICNRRFKAKESLRLHMENTHDYVGGKYDQEHSTTDYRTTHIKVEQSSSRNQKRIFKCSLCEFRVEFKQSLRRHMTTKHLKKLVIKCDSCAFRTNRKYHLEVHIKTKHLKKFDYKCEKCEFRSNRKCDLKRHLKSKHLKKFDYECDKCEYRTNRRNYLEVHIKTKHLKQFDYKCDKCDFRTNRKCYLKRHIESKDLKKLDYKCDSCKFKTNRKNNLELHIKTRHLKKFDYKCDCCEFKTNTKHHLKLHIKTNHLRGFDYKCDQCEFGTNHKGSLKYHIKTKHLMKFDFKCDSCEYRTNRKNNLGRHLNAKHL